MADKFVIQYGSNEAFYTASSAYDRPKWIKLHEATQYTLAETASGVVEKLLRHGFASARVVTVSEAMDVVFGQANKMPPLMIATNVEDADICPDCECDPCECNDGNCVSDELCSACNCNPCECNDGTCNTETITVKGPTTVVINVEESVEACKPAKVRKGERVTVKDEDGRVSADNLDDTINVETQENGASSKKVNAREVVKNLTAAVSESEIKQPKVRVPQSVMANLKQVANEYEKKVKLVNGRDDASGSFYLTVKDAANELIDILSSTDENRVQKAQTFWSSLMSPIQHIFSDDVTLFISRGGKPQTLSDLFQFKKASK